MSVRPYRKYLRGYQVLKIRRVTVFSFGHVPLHKEDGHGYIHLVFKLAAIIACYGVTSSLVKSYGLDGTPAGVIGIAALMTVVVPSVLMDGEETVEAWIAGSLDATLLFTALLVALITGEIYRKMVQKNITIKLPDPVPPAVSAQFTALIPGVVVVVLFTIVRLLFAKTVWGGFP